MLKKILKIARGKKGLFVSVLAIGLAAGLMQGCGPSAVPEDEHHASQRPLIWPPPPEPARISYLKIIEKPEDIGANKGFFSKLSDFVLGASKDEIVKPYGITVDNGGRLLLVDTSQKKVHIFDAAKNKYTYIDEVGKSSFESPIAAAADAENNIYVTDSTAGKVYAFSPKGKFFLSFDAGKRPTGIAINREDKKIYVSDTESHVINIFDLKGKKTGSIGKWGDLDGEFNHPVDIFVDRNGEIYVADTMNYRVQVFDKEGRFLFKFGKHGDGSGDFGRPKGIAVDREGHIYVADALFDTIQIFDRKGNFLLNFGAVGRDPGAFWLPCGLFIDSGDKIYVSDSYNRRIQIFEYLGNS